MGLRPTKGDEDAWNRAVESINSLDRVSTEWVPVFVQRRVSILPSGRLLLVLENEGNWRVLRPYDADQHGAIRAKRIAFTRNRARLRSRHFKNVVVPFGLTLEIFAGVNRGTVVRVRHVAIEEGLVGAFIHETARDRDDALPIVDCHGAGLNHGLAREIALRWDHGPGAIHGAVIARKAGDGEQQSHPRGSGNYHS